MSADVHTPAGVDFPAIAREAYEKSRFGYMVHWNDLLPAIRMMHIDHARDVVSIYCRHVAESEKKKGKK